VAGITRNPEQRKADVLPLNNYRLEVDGQLKSEYPTQETATTAALELKRKYPHIRVAIVNPKEQKRIPIDLPAQA
jgi:hypothetical protein